MTSTKCAQCGLVNFSTAVQCKRCGQPLNEMSAFADQRAYQQNVQPLPTAAPQNNYRQAQSFQTPPPPPVFDSHQQMFDQPPPNWCCIKCGGRNGVSIQSFKKTYLPPVAYLGFLIGPLIFLILALILRVKHHLNAPFCAQCWDGFKNQPTISTLLSLACVVALCGGIILSFAMESVAFGFLAVIAGISVGIYAKFYESKVSPKYKKVNGKLVVIDAPLVGDVTFYR
ncbi:MAG TPA: hypothetical protein VF599_03895 [Pyrinomonadaceae bacterium]|jgi:hypothetical protein